MMGRVCPRELITQAKELFFYHQTPGHRARFGRGTKSVAQAHGGRFHLQSTEGKGTQASLILPLV